MNRRSLKYHFLYKTYTKKIIFFSISFSQKAFPKHLKDFFEKILGAYLRFLVTKKLRREQFEFPLFFFLTVSKRKTYSN